MKEKYFKDLGLDDDNSKIKKLEIEYNLDELFMNLYEQKEDSKKN